jgi:hypothetical protein
MNLPFFAFASDRLACVSISFADDQGMPRDFAPINTFLRHFLPHTPAKRKSTAARHRPAVAHTGTGGDTHRGGHNI